MKINCAWRIHFTWEWPDYNLSSTGCPFTWQRGQVGSHQARGGLCTRMTRAHARLFVRRPLWRMGWETRAGFVGGDFQLLLRWTKISEMLASKVRWWTALLGALVIYYVRVPPWNGRESWAIKHECATLTGLFAGTWYKKEGAEGDCALQIPCSESLFPFSYVVLKAALHLVAGQPLACSKSVWTAAEAPTGSSFLSFKKEESPIHDSYFLKGHNKL